MPNCKKCGLEIIPVRDSLGRWQMLEIPEREINVTENKDGDVMILDINGIVVKGFQVGDAYESARYFIGTILHDCSRKEH